MASASPAIVVFTRHAELRARERGLELGEVAELVLDHHHRRRHNPGDADWLVRVRGVAVVYDWPADGDDRTTALVISAWRE